MRQSITMRLAPEVLKAARAKTLEDNGSLVRRDLQISVGELAFKVIAPADIRNSAAVPVPGETEDERKRRDDVFLAILDASV